MKAKKKSKASLTVEAMISSIILIMMMITIYSLANASNAYTKLQLAVNEAAGYCSALCSIDDNKNAQAIIKEYLIDDYPYGGERRFNEDIKLCGDKNTDIYYLAQNDTILSYYTAQLANGFQMEYDKEYVKECVCKAWILYICDTDNDPKNVLEKLYISIDDLDVSGSSFDGDTIKIDIICPYKIFSPVKLIPDLEFHIQGVSAKW